VLGIPINPGWLATLITLPVAKILLRNYDALELDQVPNAKICPSGAHGDRGGACQFVTSKAGKSLIIRQIVVTLSSYPSVSMGAFWMGQAFFSAITKTRVCSLMLRHVRHGDRRSKWHLACFRCVSIRAAVIDGVITVAAPTMPYSSSTPFSRQLPQPRQSERTWSASGPVELAQEHVP
jgi:hypothetical protein